MDAHESPHYILYKTKADHQDLAKRIMMKHLNLRFLAIFPYLVGYPHSDFTNPKDYLTVIIFFEILIRFLDPFLSPNNIVIAICNTRKHYTLASLEFCISCKLETVSNAQDHSELQQIILRESNPIFHRFFRQKLNPSVI